MVKCVYQFKVSLTEIDPQIWRCILVPETYSFWDLHVAIQDSMGWSDCHLHAFRFGTERSRVRTEIGIPDNESFGTIKTLPGWEIPISEKFNKVGSSCLYEYDFGDGWIHEVLLEGVMLKEKGSRYPQCIDGKRACPPEDCGGVSGYYRFCQIISDPTDEEYEDMLAWIGDKYDPKYFDSEQVKFDNPKQRWDLAFSDGI